METNRVGATVKDMHNRERCIKWMLYLLILLLFVADIAVLIV
jgi:hypothetical protein